VNLSVSLTEQDADCLLAAVEWALNHECGGVSDVALAEYVRQIGGRDAVEVAARKIESVAAMKRQGFDNDPDVLGSIPQPTRLRRALDLLKKVLTS
jgi:uncharacterized protein YhjY with autotransporter beta-barrel domain